MVSLEAQVEQYDQPILAFASAMEKDLTGLTPPCGHAAPAEHRTSKPAEYE